MSRERKYIDLTLELRDLDNASGTFRVAASSPDLGEPNAVTVALNLQEMADALDDLERKRIDQSALLTLGERLAARLLPPGEVRNLFVKVVNQAGQDGGVRLRLLIREPKLAQLPWEFCYWQPHDGEKDPRYFVVLNPQLSLVRHPPMAESHPLLIGATPNTLRMVAATALAQGYVDLHLDEEQQVIADALKDFNVDGVTIALAPFLRDATVNDLVLALQKGCDLFHFAGHGIFQQGIDPQTGAPIGTGSIVLEKNDRAPDLLSAGDLARYLQAGGVRVAVLGACESARVDGVSAWSGIAPAILERGVPATIAMQYEVVNAHALAFSQMFYRALAAGLSLDEAVWSGRDAMQRTPGDSIVEWGVPALYMRSPDGVIFPHLTARASPTADQLRHVFRQKADELKNAKVVGVEAKTVKRGNIEVDQDFGKIEDSEIVGGKFDEL